MKVRAEKASDSTKTSTIPADNNNSLSTSIKILESNLIEVKDQVNKQDSTICKLISNNTSNIQEFKKVFDSKMNRFQNNNSILFETINTQHVCLDDLSDRLPKQENTLEKYKKILDSKINDNTLKVRDAKSDIAHINEKLESISNDISDIQQSVNLLHKKMEMLQTEKPMVQSLHNDAAELMTPDQRPILLVLLATIWKQNEELTNLKRMETRNADTLRAAYTIKGTDKANAEETVVDFRKKSDILQQTGCDTLLQKEKEESKERRFNIFDDPEYEETDTEVYISNAKDNDAKDNKGSEKQYHEKRHHKQALLSTPIEHSVGLRPTNNSNQIATKNDKTDAVKTGANNPPNIKHTTDYNWKTVIRKRTTSAEYVPPIGNKFDSEKPAIINIPTTSRFLLLNSPSKEHQTNNKTIVKHSPQLKQSYKRTLLNTPILKRGTNSNNVSNNTHANERDRKLAGKRKCLIVHDSFLNNFDSNKFSSWFDVKTAHHKSLGALKTDGSLTDIVCTSNPEVTFIHLGTGDLLQGTDPTRLINTFKEIIYETLEKTKTKLCISLMIPITGCQTLNENISEANNALSLYISELRNCEKYQQRIYTTNNNSLGYFICKDLSSKGIGITLTERGQSKLWLRLRDSLNRALGRIQPRPRIHVSNNPRNKYSHE